MHRPGTHWTNETNWHTTTNTNSTTWRRAREPGRRTTSQPVGRSPYLRTARSASSSASSKSERLGGSEHDELPLAIPPEVLQPHGGAQVPQFALLPVFHGSGLPAGPRKLRAGGRAGVPPRGERWLGAVGGGGARPGV